MAEQVLVTEADGYEDGASWVGNDLYISDNNWSGASFLLTAEIPAGSTIDSAYLRLYALTLNSGGSSDTVALEVENADPDTVAAFSATHLPSSQTYFATINSAAHGGWNEYQNMWLLGAGDAIAINIAAALQSLVTAYGTLAVGDRINIRWRGSGSGSYIQVQESSAGANDPTLTINWTAGEGGSQALAGAASAGATAAGAASVTKPLDGAATGGAIASGQLASGAAQALAGAAVGGAAASADLTVRRFEFTLYAVDGSTPLASKTGLWWAWWDVLADVRSTAPDASGTGASTDASGVFRVGAPASLSAGDNQGFGIISDQDATPDATEAAYVGSFDVV